MRQKFDERWRETICSLVLDGQEAGEFGPVDADDFAVTLSALLDGLAVQIALDDPAVPPGPGVRAEHAVRGRGAGIHLDPAARGRGQASGGRRPAGERVAANVDPRAPRKRFLSKEVGRWPEDASNWSRSRSASPTSRWTRST